MTPPTPTWDHIFQALVLGALAIPFIKSKMTKGDQLEVAASSAVVKSIETLTENTIKSFEKFWEEIDKVKDRLHETEKDIAVINACQNQGPSVQLKPGEGFKLSVLRPEETG